MKIIFAPDALEDYKHFKQTSPKIAERIKALLRNIQETHFTGLGRPEPLRYGLTGYWSRRITAEHRLVYKIEKDEIIVISCKYHYK